MKTTWDFYGRHAEEIELRKIADRGRWFFCEISGRRRIGKTTLVNRLLERTKDKKIFYVQIPDSDPSGVLKSVNDALEDLDVPRAEFPFPRDLQQFAKLIGRLAEKEYFVVLDEFQYFHRKALYPFCSYLQAEVDRLRSRRDAAGGLFVLGSIHNEMMAVLEDRRSPLFNRVTDRLDIRHLDFAALKEMWLAHGITDPYQHLFLWGLFEGIPKFYRDCFEQGVLRPDPHHRETILRELFFKGSSPLRTEADNWFLNEFRGRYESLLKILAANDGCSHGRIMEEYSKIDSGTELRQIGGYLSVLESKFQIIQRRLPVFGSKGVSRKARYYVVDNFLLSWLGAIERQIKAARVRPMDVCVKTCSQRLETIEGHTFEKMVRLILEELSRKGDERFQITSRIEGYWNRPEDLSRSVEIDLLLVNDDAKTLRVATCKRSGDQLLRDRAEFDGHAAAFLRTKEGARFSGYKIEKMAFAPALAAGAKKKLLEDGYQAFGFDELLGRL